MLRIPFISPVRLCYDQAGMRDRNGIEVRVEYLEWQETYWGWIEGEPEHMNEVIVKEHLPRDLARWPHTPHLVLRAEERRKRSPKEPAARWLPEERVIAFLKSDWRPSAEDDESHLVVAWFQEPGDPFAQLAKIVADLDWTAHAGGWCS